MDVFYDSDWHIHFEASYDADLKVPDLIQSAKINGIKQFGITDHVNYPFMVKHLERSRDLFLANQTEGFHLGVELNTDFFCIRLLYGLFQKTICGVFMYAA